MTRSSHPTKDRALAAGGNAAKRGDLKTITRLAGTAAGVLGFLNQLRRARRDDDRLRLVHAVLNGLVLISGTALLIRGLRKDSVA